MGDGAPLGDEKHAKGAREGERWTLQDLKNKRMMDVTVDDRRA